MDESLTSATFLVMTELVNLKTILIRMSSGCKKQKTQLEQLCQQRTELCYQSN